MVYEIASKLKDARSLVSLHLSHSNEIRRAVKLALKNLVFDKMTTKLPVDEISEEWFKYPHIPHLLKDDITH